MNTRVINTLDFAMPLNDNIKTSGYESFAHCTLAIITHMMAQPAYDNVSFTDPDGILTAAHKIVQNSENTIESKTWNEEIEKDEEILFKMHTTTVSMKELKKRHFPCIYRSLVQPWGIDLDPTNVFQESMYNLGVTMYGDYYDFKSTITKQFGARHASYLNLCCEHDQSMRYLCPTFIKNQRIDNTSVEFYKSELQRYMSEFNAEIKRKNEIVAAFKQHQKDEQEAYALLDAKRKHEKGQKETKQPSKKSKSSTPKV
jgi:hypothetical protein